MTTRKHKDWLRAFVEFASYGEAPLKFYYWTGVSTIAGALRRRVWIDQKQFQWTPNCYIILVAPPGIVSKSTTANIGMNLLRKVPGISFGPDVVTWQKLVEDMAKSKELVYWPEREVYLPMSCITVASSEFGTLLDPNDREMVDVLVQLWDGQIGGFSKATKTCGSDDIENPWINIIACTTPSWIATNFPESMIGGGFTSRCIFVYAEKKRQLIAYPSMHTPPEFEQHRDDLIHDLEIISTLIGEYTLSSEAQDFGVTWYDRHWASKHDSLSPEQFGGYIARKQTHIHKLAMIIQASRSDTMKIELEALQMAVAMVDALEQEMPRVFSRIGQTAQTKGMTDLVELVAAVGQIGRIELFRKMSRYTTWFDFQKILESAVAAQFIHLTQQGNEIIIKAGKGKTA
jgi:hypothetical protein